MNPFATRAPASVSAHHASHILISLLLLPSTAQENHTQVFAITQAWFSSLLPRKRTTTLILDHIVSKKLRSFFKSIISLIHGNGFSSLGNSSSNPICVARRFAM